MEGRFEKRRRQISLVSQMEFDLADWNILEAEIMGDQGLNAGCSAVGGMELWEGWNHGRDGIMGGMELWEGWNYGRDGIMGGME